jgi:LmbE family N-acetylglucosaminyl deacetylase
MTNREPLRLMAILAHPDDEALGNGGTLARYAAEGVELSLITATCGQRGWLGDPAEDPGPDMLGRLREAELRAAAQILGIRNLVLLHYVDGELDGAEPDAAICQLVAHIRRLRPQVVLTFGPDGAYGHPDHIAISQLATSAVARAADPRYGHRCTTRGPHAVSKLYYMALGTQRAAAYASAFGDLSLQVDGRERDVVVWPDWQLTTCIDAGEHWRTAWQAVACHRSQLPNFDSLRALPDDQHRLLWGRHEYYRAFSLANGGRTLEQDLFEGLRPAARLALAA